MFIVGYLLIATGKIMSLVINIYIFLIIVDTVIAWFNLSQRNRLLQLISSLVAPALNYLRSWLPPMQIDISPLLVILGLYFFNAFIVKIILRLGNILI